MRECECFSHRNTPSKCHVSKSFCYQHHFEHNFTSHVNLNMHMKLLHIKSNHQLTYHVAQAKHCCNKRLMNTKNMKEQTGLFYSKFWKLCYLSLQKKKRGNAMRIQTVSWFDFFDSSREVLRHSFVCFNHFSNTSHDWMLQSVWKYSCNN